MAINARTGSFYFLVCSIYSARIMSHTFFQLPNEFFIVLEPFIWAATPIFTIYFTNFPHHCLNLIPHSFLTLMNQFRKQLIFYLELSTGQMSASVLLELFSQFTHIVINSICYFHEIDFAEVSLPTLLFVVLYRILGHFYQDRLMLP